MKKPKFEDHMKRRSLLRICASGAVGTIAGCNGYRSGGSDPKPVLDILSANVGKNNSRWELAVSVRNTHNWDVSIHNITHIVFSDSGDDVCRTEVGDLLKSEPSKRTMTVTCNEFPAIITAAADESPCDGADIEIQYWIGSAKQREADLPNDVRVWESTQRQCEESLPPERVLRNVSKTEED